MIKPYLFLSLIPLIFVFNSCSNGGQSVSSVKEDSAPNENNKTTMVVSPLTAEEFRDKVFDYNASSEWKFKGSLPCIVDFSASWCGPCQRLAPLLDDIAQEYDGKINVYKIDIDQESEVAEQFGIQSVPTLIFCPMEGKPRSSVGLLPKQAIVKTINEVLGVQ